MVSPRAAGAPRTSVPTGADHRTLPGRARRVEVPRITTAPVPQRQYQQQQIGRYLLSMGLRTLCFLAALVVFHFGVDGAQGAARLAAVVVAGVLITAAVVLPYISVLVANAGRETVRPTTTAYAPQGPVGLPPASGPTVVVADEPLVGTVSDPTPAPEHGGEEADGRPRGTGGSTRQDPREDPRHDAA